MSATDACCAPDRSGRCRSPPASVNSSISGRSSAARSGSSSAPRSPCGPARSPSRSSGRTRRRATWGSTSRSRPRATSARTRRSGSGLRGEASPPSWACASAISGSCSGPRHFSAPPPSSGRSWASASTCRWRGGSGVPSLAPMVVPSLDTEHPGIRVIAEVASVLQAGLASGEALHGVVSALRRGLNLRRCRLWLRTPDGTRYAVVTTSGDDADGPGLPPVAEWVRQGPQRENVPGGAVIRLPLIHDDEPLGALEVVIPTGRYEGIAHDVVVVVARILAPMIAATELSQDLASEVALRTHEMEAQRSFAAQIIDSLPVGLYVIDRAYRIRAWNRKRETGMQGVSREDAVGREIFEVLDRQPRDLLKREFDRVFDTGELQQVEMESQASGEARHYRITKIPMREDGRTISHVVTIGEDITEWRQAQQRLTETEKLAAVGQLAAGVMHEINNPLATILACCEALALRAEDLTPADRHGYDEYLKIIDTEVQRCRRIVESLLDFSRPKGGDKKPTDVNGVVDRTLFLLKHHARSKRLSVMRELASGLPSVLADHERLIQSFMALMLNALDAMDSRGTLTVRSRINPDRADEILLEFIDTGTGIKREDLPKIFEPFFTTKPQGRGTGLGLSICYGIIAEHRGRIDVESQVGVGSNFRVYLPTG